MGKREDPIHKAILKYLRLRYGGAVVAHIANEMNISGNAVGHAIAQNRAKSLGMLPGFPDLIVQWQGRTWYFEVKAPKGKLSPNQEAVRDALLSNGAYYAVVRSIEDVQLAIGGFEALRASNDGIVIRGKISGDAK